MIGRRPIIKIEGAWFQKIINPKAKAGVGLTALRLKGIAISGRHRKGSYSASYSWVDIETAIRMKLIPKAICNDENKINEYLQKYAIGEKIWIKGPGLKIVKEKPEEVQNRKTFDFNKEKAKLSKKQRKQLEKKMVA